MLLKPCLMASNGCPPSLVLRQECGLCRVPKECAALLPTPIKGKEFIGLGSLNGKTYHWEKPWNAMNESLESRQFFNSQTVMRPLLIDVPGVHPPSLLLSLGFTKQGIRHEKVFPFLGFKSREIGKCGVDLLCLSEIVILEELRTSASRLSFSPSFIHPNGGLYTQKLLLEFIQDLVHHSNYFVQSDGRVLFFGSGTGMKDVAQVTEFLLSSKLATWEKKSVLVPHYSRTDGSETQVVVKGSSFILEAATVAPLKRSEKFKQKQSTKKKTNQKLDIEKDLHKRNYLHAYENLLTLMMERRRCAKKTILSLKKSGPELPGLLAQISAGIAGTGLAVLFSVVCKMASGTSPFCMSKIINTGFGVVLVWLSCAVNGLRDTIIYISKNTGKLELKEREMIRRVDRSVSEIYFRATMLVLVALLRLA